MIKPVHRSTEERAPEIMALAELHVEEAAKLFSATTGASPLSFAIIAMSILTRDLHRLEPDAARDLSAALSDMFHPDRTPEERRKASLRRAMAAPRIFAAADLAAAKPGGRA